MFAVSMVPSAQFSLDMQGSSVYTRMTFGKQSKQFNFSRVFHAYRV